MKKEKKDSKRTKSIDTLFANIFSGKYQQFSVHQSQIGKKNQDYQGGSWCQRRQKSRSHVFSTTSANTNIIKKKEKDISQVKYFYCHKKNHYVTKCLQNKDP